MAIKGNLADIVKASVIRSILNQIKLLWEEVSGSDCIKVYVDDMLLPPTVFFDMDVDNEPILREDGKGNWLLHLTMHKAPLLRFVA